MKRYFIYIGTKKVISEHLPSNIDRGYSSRGQAHGTLIQAILHFHTMHAILNSMGKHLDFRRTNPWEFVRRTFTIK